MAVERYEFFEEKETTVEESAESKHAKIFPLILNDVSHCK